MCPPMAWPSGFTGGASLVSASLVGYGGCMVRLRPGAPPAGTGVHTARPDASGTAPAVVEALPPADRYELEDAYPIE
ncbi:hypothetical protein GCM10018953_02700 [Streptosporangium nondiastaticum]